VTGKHIISIYMHYRLQIAVPAKLSFLLNDDLQITAFFYITST